MRLALATLALGIVFSLGIVKPQSASAVTGGEFNPGRIIDDGVFFNPYTMSSNDIQAFFNAKVPTCDTWGTQPWSGGGTRAQRGTSQGYPPPYTCLKDYQENIPNKAADSYCGGNIVTGVKTAAQIIWDVSNACGVNPRVLIVLLQKEQGLVTDDWPWSIQYRSATGYGCPDTAACDSTYYGYFNQVYNAARQYQRYKIQAHLFNYRAGQANTVNWHPNGACGASSFVINTQATAGLYNFTPYRPNSAALNNLYGTGDGCSSYGNRNFWRMYNDWFGGTLLGYSWLSAGYKVMDEAKTMYIDPGRLEPGLRYRAIGVAFNSGSATWTKDGPTPVRLGTNFGNNSGFCYATWINCSRLASLNETSVPPGQFGHFEFTFQAPNNLGTYQEAFKPVAEMLSWLNYQPEGLFNVKVNPGSFTWRSNGYKIYNTAKTVQYDPGNLQPNTRYVAVAEGINTGTANWRQSGPAPVRLAAIGAPSAFCDPSWITCTRPSGLLQTGVAPGQSALFEFQFVTPATPGTYREGFKLLSETIAWMNFDDPNSWFSIRVQ